MLTFYLLLTAANVILVMIDMHGSRQAHAERIELSKMRVEFNEQTNELLAEILSEIRKEGSK